jgi:hypothetical protein
MGGAFIQAGSLAESRGKFSPSAILLAFEPRCLFVFVSNPLRSHSTDFLRL